MADKVLPDEQAPLVSVIIPCRNEVANIADAIESVTSQSYRPLEIVVADGNSDDGTIELVSEIAVDSAVEIRLVDNPARVIPAALNLAVKHADGSHIVRLDAHASMRDGYIARCVELLSTGDWAAVGGRKAAYGTTPFGKAAAVAFGSKFGAGNSYYHYGNEQREVDHVPFGAYLKTTIEAAGGWDESLLVNQDYEFDYRLRMGGGRILFDPGIRLDWRGRESVKALAKQYYRYGKGKRRMLRGRRSALKARQLVAPGLVVGLGVSLLALASPVGLVALSPAALYFTSCSVVGFIEGRRAERSFRVSSAVGVALVAMHLSWGTGFVQESLPGRRPTARDPFSGNPGTVG